MRVTRNLQKILRARRALGLKARRKVNEVSGADYETLLENRLNAYWNDAAPLRRYGRCIDENPKEPVGQHLPKASF
jgi:hypothetical protein